MDSIRSDRVIYRFILPGGLQNSRFEYARFSLSLMKPLKYCNELKPVFTLTSRRKKNVNSERTFQPSAISFPVKKFLRFDYDAVYITGRAFDRDTRRNKCMLSFLS